MSAAPVATVQIQRASSYTGFLRKFKVFVDDREVDRVKNGGAVELRMPAGVHSFVVKIDFYRSKLVTLDLAAGDRVTLQCGFVGGLSGFVASFTSLDSYIYLSADVSGSLPLTPSPATPSRVAPADAVAISLSERIERVAATMEEVRVPRGVTVTVKRSRTLEHTVDIDWSVGGSLAVDVGVKSVLGGS